MPRDLRFALRRLLHAPGFTAAAVICLALGIGAKSTIARRLEWWQSGRSDLVVSARSATSATPFFRSD